MPELSKSESNEDLGFPHQERSGSFPVSIPPRAPEPKLTRLKVNLSTPLIVKTKGGENMADPGDVIGHIGRKDVMMSKDLFIALLGREKYDELVRKEMLKIRIAKRFDDSLPAFTDEELDEQKSQIDEVMQASQEAIGPEFDPRDVTQVIQLIDSSEGPPTIKPDEYATIIPGPMLPIPPETEDTLELGSEVEAPSGGEEQTEQSGEENTEPEEVQTQPTSQPSGPVNPFTK